MDEGQYVVTVTAGLFARLQRIHEAAEVLIALSEFSVDDPRVVEAYIALVGAVRAMPPAERDLARQRGEADHDND